MLKKFLAKVEGGEIKHFEPSKFKQLLLDLEGFVIQLQIGKNVKDRSSNQNKYYWGVVIKIIAKETGQDEETIHETMKMLFLQDHIILNGEEVVTLKSTAKLTTIEMEDYMAKIRTWCSKKLNLYVPTPNETSFDYTVK